MTVEIRLLVGALPLRRTVLSYRSDRSDGEASLAITDDDGNARLPAVGRSAAVRVLARTSVARAVHRSTSAVSIVVRDGDERDIAGLPGSAAVALSLAAVHVYDRGLREFPPFRDAPDPAWPLSATGPALGLGTPVIDIVYPDRSPARLPYVEPAAPRTRRPRIRLQQGDLSGDGCPRDPAMLAHELAHALHFSLMPTRRRIGIETRYLAWLAARVATGREPTHATEQHTSEFVAWIEALGLFAERYDRYVTAGDGPTVEPSQQHADFVRQEVERWQHVWEVPDPAMEGSVYGTRILLPARRTSLASAVGAYLTAA